MNLKLNTALWHRSKALPVIVLASTTSSSPLEMISRWFEQYSILKQWNSGKPAGKPRIPGFHNFRNLFGMNRQSFYGCFPCFQLTLGRSQQREKGGCWLWNISKTVLSSRPSLQEHILRLLWNTQSVSQASGRDGDTFAWHGLFIVQKTGSHQVGSRTCSDVDVWWLRKLQKTTLSPSF